MLTGHSICRNNSKGAGVFPHPPLICISKDAEKVSKNTSQTKISQKRQKLLKEQEINDKILNWRDVHFSLQGFVSWTHSLCKKKEAVFPQKRFYKQAVLRFAVACRGRMRLNRNPTRRGDGLWTFAWRSLADFRWRIRECIPTDYSLAREPWILNSTLKKRDLAAKWPRFCMAMLFSTVSLQPEKLQTDNLACREIYRKEYGLVIRNEQAIFSELGLWIKS